jgi:hypothetical protein
MLALSWTASSGSGTGFPALRSVRSFSAFGFISSRVAICGVGGSLGGGKGADSTGAVGAGEAAGAAAAGGADSCAGEQRSGALVQGQGRSGDRSRTERERERDAEYYRRDLGGDVELLDVGDEIGADGPQVGYLQNVRAVLRPLGRSEMKRMNTESA